MTGATTDPKSQSPLTAAVAPLCSLGLYAAVAAGSVVGRSRELAAVRQAIASARLGMAGVVIEGEPGIGKTRFLLAVEELARADGFVPIGVTADEEIRGPFLLARSIFASPAALEAVKGTPAATPWQRAMEALENPVEAGFESLAADRRQVRVLDFAALAVRALSEHAPLALLVDDLQWADEDSIRMLRYIVRTDAAQPVLLLLALRSR